MIKVNDNNCDMVLREKSAIIVFTAEWCYPCPRVKEIIEEVGKERGIKTYEADVNDNSFLCVKLNVGGVPTVVFMRNGLVVDAITGIKPKSFYDNIAVKLV